MVTVTQLKNLRIQAGLSQVALAAALEIDRTAISKIESGDRNITLEEGNRWVQACGHQLAVFGPQHEVGLRALIALDGLRLHVALRTLRLLAYIEDAHVITLDALAERWERVGFSIAEGQRIVKR